eukprot:scaffold3323_cov279-Pinguiococcus_pyrenoidosus.AAC.11
MISQLEAEGYKVDESLDGEAGARVDMDRLEATVRQQIDDKFEKAAKEMKELAEKRRAESDEKARKKYEESLAMLENQEQDAEDRLARFKELAGGFEGVEQDAAMARAEIARLEEVKKVSSTAPRHHGRQDASRDALRFLSAASQELDSIAASPEVQLGAFKYKTLTQQGKGNAGSAMGASVVVGAFVVVGAYVVMGAFVVVGAYVVMGAFVVVGALHRLTRLPFRFSASLVAAVALLLLSVNTGADVVAGLSSGDAQFASAAGSRFVLEILGAGLGSVVYGLWGDELPKMEE